MSTKDPKDGTPRSGERAGKPAPKEPQRRDDAAGSTSGASPFLKDKRPRSTRPAYERNEPGQHRSSNPERREYQPRDERRDETPRRSYNPNFTSDNRPRFNEDRPARNFNREERDFDRNNRDFNRQDTPSDGPRYTPSARKSPYPQSARRSEGYGNRDNSSYKKYDDRPRRNDSYGNRDDRPRRTEGFGGRDNASPYKKYDSPPPRNEGFGSRDNAPYKKDFGSRDDRPRRNDSYGNRDDRPRRTEGYGNRDNTPYKKYDGRPPRNEGFGGRDNAPYKKDFGSRDDRPRRNDSYGNRDDRPRNYQSGPRKYDNRKGGDRSFSKPAYDKDNYPRFEPPKATGAVRLNRFIANSGISSRREADDLIRAGVVTVNGQVVTEMGTKVLPTDEIRFNDELLRGEKKVYIVMNKPRGYVTSVEDPHADKLVMDLLGDACQERIYPVGRLDKNSVGVLLITNDGELTRQLTHPSYNKKKIYQVSLSKPVAQADMQRLADGIELEDGLIFADEVSYVDENRKEVGIEIHSGRNRIVRRMFEALGYTVTKLDRVYFGGLTKKRLKRGGWRFLTPLEVSRLKSGEYE